MLNQYKISLLVRYCPEYRLDCPMIAILFSDRISLAYTLSNILAHSCAEAIVSMHSQPCREASAPLPECLRKDRFWLIAK